LQAARSDRNRQGPYPLKSGASIQGDQAAVWLSEDQAEGHDQESLQDECTGSLEESVPDAAAVTCNNLSVRMVCLNALIQPQQ